ncbi:thiamine biosynthesis protein ThiS [Fibrobacter sp. UWH1]|nr:thiamine biosynthesis protein ThiS [Fibrobacter sp. UWH1]
MKVNGIDVETDGKSFVGKSVAEYLSTTNFDCKRIAVEKNGDIVPKAKYGETLLAEGDSLEVVSFVGGG